jgi:hypothetical protein
MQERHPTPPPSPFASYFQGSEAGEEDEDMTPLEDLRLDACKAVDQARGGGETVDQLRVVPVMGNGVMGNGSLTLPPDTPSAVSEAQLVALSRNGSVISDPTLAELLQAKLACNDKYTLEDASRLAGK